jgi:hypothetical protein
MWNLAHRRVLRSTTRVPAIDFLCRKSNVDVDLILDSRGHFFHANDLVSDKLCRSLFATAWGIILLTVAFDLKLFALVGSTLLEILIAAGWIPMVTGFSLILYSRLHLITHNRRILQICLGFIIFDGIIVHVPGVVSGFITGPAGAKFYKYASSLEVIFSVRLCPKIYVFYD